MLMAGLFRKIFGGNTEKVVEKPPRVRLSLDPLAYAAIYAIGDVHGCYEALIEAERRIVEDASLIAGPKLIVLLGDYVDRGKRSRDVLQHLCAPAPEGFHRVALCGNHDDAFFKFLTAPRTNIGWLEFGGEETLYSYGVDAKYLFSQGRGGLDALCAAIRLAVPTEHIELLRSMPIALSIGDLIFVHAGVRPGVSMDSQSDRDLMWIREPFITKGPQLPSLVIHGHTPDMKPVFASGRIGIDTAAFATGNLTVLKIAGGEPSVFPVAA
jgi:serine/threonine protein phosphatase 1|nr:metallophosphoesterase family protein [Rhizobium sp. BK376]